MGLIKANKAPLTIQPFSLHDIELQAKAIIQHAQMQAEQLIELAVKEAAVAREEARRQGYTEGVQTGLAEGRETGHKEALEEFRQSLSGLTEQLSKALDEIEFSRQRLETEALNEVVELSLSVARRVTKRQAIVEPAVLSSNLAETLKLVVHSTDVRIAVNPAQKKLIEEELPRIQLAWPNLGHIELIEDAKIAPGGCRVFNRDGQIDGDLNAQLDRITAELLPSEAGA
jgi:flagellar assembly protein FliH